MVKDAVYTFSSAAHEPWLLSWNEDGGQICNHFKVGKPVRKAFGLGEPQKIYIQIHFMFAATLETVFISAQYN